MEDEFFVAPDSRFVGVFDGHGGSKVSEFLRENLYGGFREALGRGGEGLDETEEALRVCLREADKVVQSKGRWSYQGSTAVVCVLHTDEAEGGATTVLSANVGDSRAVLSREGEAVDLTTDHKPNDPREKVRGVSVVRKRSFPHRRRAHTLLTHPHTSSHTHAHTYTPCTETRHRPRR